MTRVAVGTESTGRHATDHVPVISALVLVGLIATTPAFAQLQQQTQTQSPTWRITRSISVSATATDNVALAPDDRKESDFIYQVVPSFGITSTGGGRVKLNVNYRAQ